MLSTAAYRRHVARLKPHPEHAQEWRQAILSTDVCGELQQALATACATLLRQPADRIAVRSSADAEDLADSSFAGLHDSFLDIASAEQCLRAVRKCWASLWSDRAVAYRERRGFDHRQVAMAVVVQALIPAEVSGVAFTLDPRTGNRDTVILEAVPGLGESLVSGQVTPDQFTIARASRDILERSETNTAGLGDDQVQQVTDLAVSLEDAIGTPQDVEWCFADGQLWVLQSRPITTLPTASATTLWSNVNAGEVLPDVVTPLTWSLLQGLERMIGDCLDRAGIDVGDEPLIGRVAGRIYFNLSTFMGIARRLPRGDVFDMGRLLGGETVDLNRVDVPMIRTSLWRVLVHLPGFLFWLWQHRPSRAGEALDAMVSRRTRWQAVDLRSLAADELVAHVQRIVDHLSSNAGILAFPAVGMTCYSLLDAACKRWFPDNELATANALLAGCGGLDSADAGIDLYRIAAFAHQHNTVRDSLIAHKNFAELEHALQGDAQGQEFLALWQRFHDQHGHHARGEIELFNPRWRETPDELLAMVRSYLVAMPGTDRLARLEQRARERRDQLAACRRRLGTVRLTLFDLLMDGAATGSAVRENLKSEAVRHVALIREATLVLGDQLVGQGRLSRQGDTFFLTLEELAELVSSPDSSDKRETVARRREEHERFEALTPPAIVMGEFDPTQPVSAPVYQDGDQLTGLAVSPGVVTGPARVILRASAEETVLPGEILVAPFTDPGWTPYFISAAGIVIDLGGLLSHGSIVAREYGIPTVVNVGAGTQRIRTGQQVTVDGNRGTVTIQPDP